MDDDHPLETDLSDLSFRPREAVFRDVPAEGELYGQRNRSNETRPNATQKDFFGGSIICTTDQVTYGKLNGKRACLICFRFKIRYTRNSKPLTQADVQVKFGPLSSKKFRSSSGAVREPVVKVVSPGKLLGTPDESGMSWKWSISKLCEGSGLKVTVPTALTGLNLDIRTISQKLLMKGEPWKNLRERDNDMACLEMADHSHNPIGVPDEFKLAMIVECDGHFEAIVDIDANISRRQKLKAFPFPADDPVIFFEGPENTPIGRTLATSNFEQLSGEQWLELVLFNNLTHVDTTTAGDAIKPVKPSPRAKSQHFTCRVQGIPAYIARDDVGDFLANTVQMESLGDVEVRSFARDPRSANEMTATVTSEGLSEVLGARERCNFNVSNVKVLGELSILIDIKFDDFTVLSDPEEPASFDIIALSGLGAHSFGSFKDRGGKHMWLADRLPYDLPKARIMIYGYETGLLNSHSFQDLEAIANTMRSALKTVRSAANSQHRPIIFIAHSLGGLVLKQLLLQMINGDARDHVNVHNTIGLIMFGVPNLGMSISSLRGKVKDQPNESFLQSLRPDSESLRKLNRDFKEQFVSRQCKIISVYETEESPTARKAPNGIWRMDGPPAVIVSQDSATGGSRHWESGPNYEIPLKRIHSELVKFYPRDPGYFVVKDQLDDLLRLNDLA